MYGSRKTALGGLLKFELLFTIFEGFLDYIHKKIISKYEVSMSIINAPNGGESGGQKS